MRATPTRCAAAVAGLRLWSLSTATCTLGRHRTPAGPPGPHLAPPPPPPPSPLAPLQLCDQVSDAILDACLEQDPESKVACETATKTNLVMVFGEITTLAKVDYEKVVRDTCRNIGFISDDVGLDADKCKVLVHIEEQVRRWVGAAPTPGGVWPPAVVPRLAPARLLLLSACFFLASCPPTP